MRNPTEKGKISHTEWSAIWGRHESGETIASIARHYRCTAPAIRYILRRHASGTPAARLVPMAAAAGERHARRRHNGSRALITPELQRRITKEISVFLVALDSALLDGTDQSVNSLHDAADMLMRAAARIRIELDRPLDAGVTAAAAPALEPEGAS